MVVAQPSYFLFFFFFWPPQDMNFLCQGSEPSRSHNLNCSCILNPLCWLGMELASQCSQNTTDPIVPQGDSRCFLIHQVQGRGPGSSHKLTNSKRTLMPPAGAYTFISLH